MSPDVIVMERDEFDRYVDEEVRRRLLDRPEIERLVVEEAERLHRQHAAFRALVAGVYGNGIKVRRFDTETIEGPYRTVVGLPSQVSRGDTVVCQWVSTGDAYEVIVAYKLAYDSSDVKRAPQTI